MESCFAKIIGKVAGGSTRLFFYTHYEMKFSLVFIILCDGFLCIDCTKEHQHP